MIAKYNGFCRVTNQKIIAGKTEIIKVNGKWQCAESESAMTRNSRIKSIVMAPPTGDEWDTIEAEEKAYQDAKEAAVSSLHAQFPDVAPEQWRAAISNAMSLFPKDIHFTSAAKEAAFNQAIANL